MKNFSSSLFLVCFLFLHLHATWAQSQVYIVYFGGHSGEKTAQEIEDLHHSYLYSVKASKEEAKASLVYSYKNIINGFSALLTPDEAAKLSEMEEVVSVIHSHPSKYKLQTTRSWDFTSLLEANGGDLSHSYGEELLQKAKYGRNIIIGVMDSGIWPESKSFSDEGMEPIPKSWRGICQKGVAFNSSNCNRKIIGTRYYLKSYEANYGKLNKSEDYRSPRDINGHGTHTASTIAGRSVPNVSSLGGFAGGTAIGGAPLARLAIYKVCWPVPNQNPAEGNTCLPDDMLAAFDDAIVDGVNVISVSIGFQNAVSYAQDGISIGALHATKRNIVVVCSAGNSGASTVTNVAPWILTVGASSIDRDFPSPVVLGNGLKVEGQTSSPFKKRKTHPLVFAGDVELPGKTNKTTSGFCSPGTLSPKLVKGKVILCRSGSIFQAMEVKRAGGEAAILGNPYVGEEVIVNTDVLPDTTILFNATVSILRYINNTKNPTAMLVPGKTVLGNKPAPVMAPFTSTGPNGIEPNILKPDITAPGVNILAAWSEASSPTKLIGDRRVVKYKIDSGTSMACPHVSAVAALLKAIHPNWSSAAIKSALMTTATTNNNIGKPITDSTGNLATPFYYGSGHFQPSKAADPGLVYDTRYQDYLLFLCYARERHLDPTFKCPKHAPTPSNLNSPSLAIANLNRSMIVRRTVTNVGPASNSLYSSSVESPEGYTVEIYPNVLIFSKVGEKKSFSIRLKAKHGVRKRKGYSFGWYSWSDGIHVVRSPIVISST